MRAPGLWTASPPDFSLRTRYCGSSFEARTVRPASSVSEVISLTTSPEAVPPWERQVTWSPGCSRSLMRGTYPATVRGMWGRPSRRPGLHVAYGAWVTIGAAGAPPDPDPCPEFTDPASRPDPALVAAAADLAARWEPASPPQLLSSRGEAVVVARGDVVVKVHHSATDAADLAARLRVAAGDASGVLARPWDATVHRAAGRLLTAWPRAAVLGVDDLDDAPWAELGALAARLQRRTPRLAGMPGARAGLRVAEALHRLAVTPAAGAEAVGPAVARARDLVLRAGAALPAWTRGEPAGDAAEAGLPVAVVHADLHLGQLGRFGGPDGGWRLLDVDDLGVGAAAWDLARPAAWYAAGVLDPADWAAFLDAYRTEGGPAVPPDGDPWPWLDAVARALAVQTAARAVIEAVIVGRELDTVGESFLRASAAIVEDSRPGRDSGPR